MAHHTSLPGNVPPTAQTSGPSTEGGSGSSGNLPGVGRVGVQVAGHESLKQAGLISQASGQGPSGRTQRMPALHSKMKLTKREQEKYEHVLQIYPGIKEKLRSFSYFEKKALAEQQEIMEAYSSHPSYPAEMPGIWGALIRVIQDRRKNRVTGPLPPILPSDRVKDGGQRLDSYIFAVQYPCFPAEDSLSNLISSWSRKDACKKAFEEEGYFVSSWEPPRENMSRREIDRALRDVLEEREFDDDIGATLLFFDSSAADDKKTEECLIWPGQQGKDRLAFHVQEVQEEEGNSAPFFGKPSDVGEKFLIEGKRWKDVSHLFIAPSFVAKMLCALRIIESAGEGQGYIAEYARKRGISPETDMDFDEVSNLIYTLNPRAVIAIYDPVKLNADGFASVMLGKTRAPFMLARHAPEVPSCNQVEGICFNVDPRISPTKTLDTSHCLPKKNSPIETPENYLRRMEDLGPILFISLRPLLVPPNLYMGAPSDAQKKDIKASMSVFKLAGIPIDPEDDNDVSEFLLHARCLYGDVPLMTNFIYARYLREKFAGRREEEKINATLELKRGEQPLFEPGEEVTPCIIQYWFDKTLHSAVVYKNKRNGQVVFEDGKGRSGPISSLKELLHRQGAVSVLKLKGRGLRSPGSGSSI